MDLSVRNSGTISLTWYSSSLRSSSVKGTPFDSRCSQARVTGIAYLLAHFVPFFVVLMPWSVVYVRLTTAASWMWLIW